MQDLKNRQIIYGGTGAIGRELIDELVRLNADVTAIVRRKSDLPKEVKQVIVEDQSDSSTYKELLTDSDVYICIGTTNAKTPDEETYYRIDHDIPVSIAKASSDARSLHVVSALGANSNSRIFYNRTKGEMERDVKNTFDDVYIYQPALLLGDRDEKRAGESFAKWLFTTFSFLVPSKYKGIHHKTVALNMIQNAQALPEKKRWLSQEMRER